ncbi:MAG: hypothetical protein IPI35_23085 [Deltaproteobacteria bacterium]|nr:hypothetical protein [Deltaproteobacteria bacterium]
MRRCGSAWRGSYDGPKRPQEVAKRAFDGARTVGNTFLGSAGGQSLPEVEPSQDDGLEPGGAHVLHVTPPEEPDP